MNIQYIGNKEAVKVCMYATCFIYSIFFIVIIMWLKASVVEERYKITALHLQF